MFIRMQTEAPLLVRPFLEDMTRSELHAVMTCGFATIAGGVMAAYVLFGVSVIKLCSTNITVFYQLTLELLNSCKCSLKFGN